MRWVVLTNLHTHHVGGLSHFRGREILAQVAVVVREDYHVLFLAGHSSYTQELMLRGVVGGIASEERAARETLERIRGLVAETTTVYLPAHDPDTPARLAGRERVRV